MKLVYIDGEKERLEETYEKLSLQIFDDPDRIYSINFKVKNPAIAQFIFTSLLHDKLDDVDLGISVTSINFNQIQDKDVIKEKLHQMINNIIDNG